MGKSARVTSIDALADMAKAIQTFRNDATAALEELEMQIRRALEWIHHDRKEHWTREYRRSGDRLTEARIALQQAMMMKRVADRDPSCFDEKKAIQRAKQREEMAQEKIGAVRHCSALIEHAVNEYRAARGPLATYLDCDVPKALATLERLIETLETYLAVQAAGGGAAPLELPAEVEGQMQAAIAAAGNTEEQKKEEEGECSMNNVQCSMKDQDSIQTDGGPSSFNIEP